MKKIIRALGVHAEKLHDNGVWTRLQTIFKIMEYKKSTATFFVYPSRSLAVGEDIQDHLNDLALRGYEIGQHTHFYAPGTLKGHPKRDDFSPENVYAAISRDYEYINQAGIVPRGFTAGAWIFPTFLPDILVDKGFSYDCSRRVRAFNKGDASPHLVFADYPNIKRVNGKRLIFLSTTHTLEDIVSFKRINQAYYLSQDFMYQKIYLHDYDLLKIKIWVGLCLFFMSSPGIKNVSSLVDIMLCRVN